MITNKLSHIQVIQIILVDTDICVCMVFMYEASEYQEESHLSDLDNMTKYRTQVIAMRG